MSNKTRNSNSRSTAVTVEKTTGVQEDVVGTTSTTSDPSGLRAPDGTNTPPKSGDAAGDASADLVKPQVSSDHTETLKVEAENQTPSPAVEALASGDMSKDDNAVVAASLSAGSDQSDFALGIILDQVAATSADTVVRLMVIGKDTLEAIEAISAIYPNYQKWLGDENPADIIPALVNDIRAVNALVNGVMSIRSDASTEAEDFINQPTDRFPLTQALLKDWDERRAPVIRITSKEAGFFRGGIRHPAHATDYPIETLSPDQLENILGEDLLTVEVV